MWIAIASGLIVSIDALFIGVSLGSQRRCKFWHLLVINAVLLGLCLLGYLLGILIGGRIDIELDLVIGLLFISLGVWTIVQYFLFVRGKENAEKRFGIVLTGLFMSIEAMFITIGLTLMLDVTTILIPLTVAFAHFAYSVTTFFLAKYLRRRLPSIAGHIISGLCLIAYGVMAIVL